MYAVFQTLILCYKKHDGFVIYSKPAMAFKVSAGAIPSGTNKRRYSNTAAIETR